MNRSTLPLVVPGAFALSFCQTAGTAAQKAASKDTGNTAGDAAKEAGTQ